MMTEQEHNNVQCTIFAQTERSSQIHLDDAEVQPKITQKRSGCVMDNVQWRKVKLGDCLSIGNGCDYKHLKEGDIPVFGTGGIMTYVDNYLYDGETVCIGRKGTINHPMYHIGKIWTVDTLFYTHSFVGVIPKFIYYTFCNIDWNKYNEATGVPSLSKETIYKIEIPVPDLSAQRRITAILTSADKVIAATQKTIAKYKQMKQGMMEDLLKPKEGWKMVRLGEVIDDSYAGGTPNRSRSDYFGGDIPWVSSGEVNNPEIHSTIENITIEGLNNSSAKWIPENSILVALYGATAGQVSMLRIKATSNQAVLAVIPNAEIADTKFLFYQIVYNKDNLLYLAQGSGQPNLSKNLVDRLEISIPDLSEQRRIAAILSGIDAKIAAEEKALEKYTLVKKGLMEKLLNNNK